MKPRVGAVMAGAGRAGGNVELARGRRSRAAVRVEGRAGDCFGSTCYCEPYQGEYLVGLHVIRRGKDTAIEQFNE